MNVSNQKLKAFLLVILLIGVYALASQLYLTIINRTVPTAEVVIQYFTYFTIQCNILVALCAATTLLSSKQKKTMFFARSSTFTAVTVYITVVGVVYNIILRKIWTPVGSQMVTNELLHVVMPVLFLLFWLFFVPKQHLTWNILLWLIYPFVYAVLAVLRGAFSGFYPYPFLDVAKLGYTQVFINSCGLVVVFTGLSFLFVAVGKFLAGKQRL